uniref:Dynein_C domain-containing protein n=1 Tax=Brugia timori TaxID=42155 RepID=A0A0R3R221_9BILA
LNWKDSFQALLQRQLDPLFGQFAEDPALPAVSRIPQLPIGSELVMLVKDLVGLQNTEYTYGDLIF